MIVVFLLLSSHLVSIPAGTSLSDALRQSPIVDGGDGGAASAGGAFDIDADAANDPELAMALRISLEEQRARQQQGTSNDENNEEQPAAQPMDDDQAMLQSILLLDNTRLNINTRCINDEHGRWWCKQCWRCCRCWRC